MPYLFQADSDHLIELFIYQANINPISTTIEFIFCINTSPFKLFKTDPNQSEIF